MLDSNLPNFDALNKGSERVLPERELKYLRVGEITPILDSQGLVRRVLPNQGITVLYSEPNLGKSFLAMAMSFSIARGVDWLGHECEQGGVLYVAAEGGVSVHNRVFAYLKHHDLDGKDIPLWIMTEPIDLVNSDKDANQIIKICNEIQESTGVKIKLVVFDTLSRCFAGMDENSSQAMGSAITHIDQIRNEIECSILLVHHVGKDKSRGSRGHSSLRAAADCEILIEDKMIKVVKQRDFERLEPFGFTLKPVQVGLTSAGESVTSCVVESRTVDPKENEPQFTESALQALEVLRSLSVDGKQVKVFEWKDRFLELHYPGAPKQTRYSAFKRSAEQLFAKKKVGTRGDVAWVI